MRKKITKYVLGIILVVTYILVISSSLLSNIKDGDGPVYGALTRLISEGYVPIRDFFSFQMDFFLYVYTYWFKVTQFSFLSARLFTIFLRFLSLTVLFIGLSRLFAIKLWEFLTVVLIFKYFFLLQSGLHHTQLTFCGVMLCLGLSALALTQNTQKAKYAFILCLGVSVGLTTNTRLIYAGLLFPFFLLNVILDNTKNNSFLKRCGFFLLGFLLTTPLLISQLAEFGLNKMLFVKLTNSALPYMGVRKHIPNYGYMKLSDAVKLVLYDRNLWFFLITSFFTVSLLLKELKQSRSTNANNLAKTQTKYLAFSFSIIAGIFLFYCTYHSINFWYLYPVFPCLLLPCLWLIGKAKSQQKKLILGIGVAFFASNEIYNYFSSGENILRNYKIVDWKNFQTLTYQKLKVEWNPSLGYAEVDELLRSKNTSPYTGKYLDLDGVYSFERGIRINPKLPSLGGSSVAYYLNLLDQKTLDSFGLHPAKLQELHLIPSGFIKETLRKKEYDFAVGYPSFLDPEETFVFSSLYSVGKDHVRSYMVFYRHPTNVLR